MSSANRGSFTSFTIWIPFISFSSLIVMARTSKTLLSKSGESGPPCLVPNLRRNAFSFSPLRMIFAVGLSYIYDLYYVEVGSLYGHFLESSYHKWVLNLLKPFSTAIEMTIWFVSFNLLQCITLLDL